MKWTKQRLNNLFFILGIAAVVVMLLTFDVSFIELWQHLCHAGYWLIPIVGVWIIVYGLNAFAWKAIIEGNCQHLSPNTQHPSPNTHHPSTATSTSITDMRLKMASRRYSSS